ncbi:MAG: class I SAM-dependent methyltransferase [Dehalococcoidia bacterium]
MDRHSILEMGNLLMVQERERLLSKVLRRHDIHSLDGYRAFEAGCSTGYNLRLMVQWGARPKDQAGIDISGEAVDYCRSHSPEITWHLGSADKIREPDRRFDLAMAFTLFSSVPDEDVAHGIARELFRITKPGGLILVYDMRRQNPGNDEVHPVGLEQIRRWFPTCPVRAHHLTLAPPIARRVCRFVPGLYGPLALVPWLRTHTMFVLRRPGTALATIGNEGAEVKGFSRS